MYTKKVDEEINGLNAEQISGFALQCAVRILPFIAIGGNFNFWNQKNKQKHLYTLLNLIDLGYRLAYTRVDIMDAQADTMDVITAAIDTVANRANTIYEAIADTEADVMAGTIAAIIDARGIIIDASVANMDARVDMAGKYGRVAGNSVTAIAAAIEAVIAATIAEIRNAIAVSKATIASMADGTARDATVALAATRAAEAATKVARTSCKEAATLCLYAASDTDALYIASFRTMLLQELQSIKSEKASREIDANLIEPYQEIWEGFLSALEKEECQYWANIYESLPSLGFKMDVEELRNRLFSVPFEIKHQGASAVGSFLEKLLRGAVELNEARIVILGDKGSGKTCLARRLVDPDAPMTRKKDSTPGVDTSVWQPVGEEIKINIWDFAGHTVTHAVHQFFLSERCVYLIVFNSRTEDKSRLDYWLSNTKNYGKGSKIFIIVNLMDENHVDVHINTLREKFGDEDIEVRYFSIKDHRDQLNGFRKEITAYITENPSWNRQLLSSEHFKVKEWLELLFAKGNPKKGKEHISKSDFINSCEEWGITDTETLLRDLNDLGISLYYKELSDYNTLVLNPEWISVGVYKVINWVANQKTHSIKFRDFNLVFSTSKRYSENHYPFLFDLIKHYQLAFETEKKRELVFPHLLPYDRPRELPKFQDSDSLNLRYIVEHPLPPDTISRFIVKHHAQIKKLKTTQDRPYLVWRFGVVLESESTIAMVREGDRTVTVSAKGEHATRLIAELRSTLNDIFENYRSQRANLKLEYQVIEQMQSESGAEVLDIQNPIWKTDSSLINHLKANQPLFDDSRNRYITLNYTVNQYAINADNVVTGGRVHNVAKNTFNFYNCNVELQGNLNELAEYLIEKGHPEEAKELQSAAKALDKSKNITARDDLKRKGLGNRLRRLLKDLGDEESRLHKLVKGIKYGVNTAQEIAEKYNKIAQWLGWPQVPKPFLKNS